MTLPPSLETLVKQHYEYRHFGSVSILLMGVASFWSSRQLKAASPSKIPYLLFLAVAICLVSAGLTVRLSAEKGEVEAVRRVVEGTETVQTRLAAVRPLLSSTRLAAGTEAVVALGLLFRSWRGWKGLATAGVGFHFTVQMVIMAAAELYALWHLSHHVKALEELKDRF